MVRYSVGSRVEIWNWLSVNKLTEEQIMSYLIFNSLLDLFRSTYIFAIMW